MNREKQFSEEFLNAFVDDQLVAEEKSCVYIEIGRDEILNRKVCELRKLRGLVQLAYQNPPAPPAQAQFGARARRSGLRAGFAASLLLALGAFVGSQLELQPATRAPAVAGVASSTSTLLPNTTPATRPQPAAGVLLAADPSSDDRGAYRNQGSKVLIHIARDEPAQLSEALNEVESLLRYYRDSRQNARVEVVINGKGLELVRVETSAFADRIQLLQREFDNLTFAACQNTIDRLRNEQGIIVRLLPGVVVIDSGMAELMRRQNQGWTYIQV